ncbi:hypothetical protein, partial [Klebsiella pneumoniae]|uniref:hypothetical protein n=1 Tax=Klebsiella pneumoniae TaxID=573 RepID=UPI0035C0ECB9
DGSWRIKQHLFDQHHGALFPLVDAFRSLLLPLPAPLKPCQRSLSSTCNSSTAWPSTPGSALITTAGRSAPTARKAMSRSEGTLLKSHVVVNGHTKI